MNFNIPFIVSGKLVHDVIYFSGNWSNGAMDCKDDKDVSYIYHNKHSKPLIIEVEYDKSQDGTIKNYYFIGEHKDGLIKITSFRGHEDWENFSRDACILFYKESEGIPDFSKLDSKLKVGTDLTIE